ncbi:hypothetical protein [Bifidobacterium thermophilum]|uniref:hypothetical protein n=1 Tax=Bifidobacterium thermophilum TaxID=33905 RepID=UPI0030B5CC76
MSGMSPAMSHVVGILENHDFGPGGSVTCQSVSCKCGEGEGHDITITDDSVQGGVYLESHGADCLYRGDSEDARHNLIDALGLTPDDLWNDGAWNGCGTPHHDLPHKPVTTRKAGALADGEAAPVRDVWQDTPTADTTGGSQWDGVLDDEATMPVDEPAVPDDGGVMAYAGPLIEGDPYEWFIRGAGEASRGYLEAIGGAAFRSGASPMATIAACVCRALVAAPPRMVTPAYVGGPENYGSLNMFIGIVGKPGQGKDTAMTLAGSLVPDIRKPLETIPASGESLATMFAAQRKDTGDDGQDGHTTDTGWYCANPRVFLVVHEVSELTAVMGKDGSTLTPVLNKLYMGQPLGAFTKGTSKRYSVPTYGYRACMAICIQPGKAGPLLKENDSGLPQRIGLSLANDKYCRQRDTTGPFEYPRFDLGYLPDDDMQGLQRMYGGERWQNLNNLCVIEYPPEVGKATKDHRLDTLEADTFATTPNTGMDGHDNLGTIKLAAGFAILRYGYKYAKDRRSPLENGHMRVTMDDWRTAERFGMYSRWVWNQLIAYQEEARIEYAAQRETDRQAARVRANENKAEDRAAAKQRIIGIFTHPPKGLTPDKGKDKATRRRYRAHTYTGREIRANVKRGRDYVRDILEDMKADGMVNVAQDTGAWTTSTYRLNRT